MPRALVIGNGSMLATFDHNLEMRDFYFPHVGMEDHTGFGDRHRVGVWVEGKGIRWFSDPSWQITVHYKAETMVGLSRLCNDELGLELTAEDFIHPVYNILLRQFSIKSTDGEEKAVRFFFNHDFHIYGDKQKDTAFYEPYTNTVIHYRHRRYFLIGGETSQPIECITGKKGGRYASALRTMEHRKACDISSYTVGKSEYQGMEGTWRDAEDGELSGNTIEQGSVDSTIGIHCSVGPGKTTHVAIWVCAGKNLEEVISLQETIMKEGTERLHRNAHNYWKSWVNKVQYGFGSLSGDLVELFKHSLLIIRMHADSKGGIVAAADSDIMAFNKDTYTYVWPRDGALVCMALDDAGYMEVTRRFFEFCTAVQTPDGYLLHKYNPDFSVGSSWHPWYRDGKPQLPIQEDETALILVALWHHFEKIQDFEFLQHMWVNFVKSAAQFLHDFREEETDLPLMSYDPWEEYRGVFTYNTACTIAGLTAASHIAHILGHYRHSERYQTTADMMKQAMIFHLYDEEAGRFIKWIERSHGKTTMRDTTPDASLCFIWKLGVLPPSDPRIVSTMEQLKEQLTVHTPIGGLARYTNDVYHSVTAPSKEVPGNPWVITTLWGAQWDIARAQSLEDLEPAQEALKWTCRHASSAGILAEQVNPYSGEHLSVAPLIWSHATYVETVLQFLRKERELIQQTSS